MIVIAGVYFAQAMQGGPIKIGYSSNARKRLEALQTGSPVPLRFVAFIHGATRQDELILHYRFHDHRLYGEWFAEDAPGLAEVVAEHVTDIPPAGRRRRAVLEGGGRQHTIVKLAKPPRMVTRVELAQEFQVSERTIQRGEQDGSFAFVVVDGVRLFDLEAVTASLPRSSGAAA